MQLRSYKKDIFNNINSIQIVMKFIDHMIVSIFTLYNRNRTRLW
jgi:hypothetical protein